MESQEDYVTFSEKLHHLRELAQWVDAAFGRASDLAGCLRAAAEEDDLDERHKILTMAAENVKQLRALKTKAMSEVRQISLFHDVKQCPMSQKGLIASQNMLAIVADLHKECRREVMRAVELHLGISEEE